MALKDTLTADEFKGLDEGVRGLYVEKGGSYLLDVEGREDVSGLKSALEKERAAAKTFREQIKAWEALGATPDEISAMLKSQKKQEPKDKPQEPTNPTAEQLAEMRRLMDEMRSAQAATQQELRQERIEKLLMDYPEAQRALLVSLVKGTTPEEISESVKALKEAFPVQLQAKLGGVGGPSNPPSKKEIDDAAAEFGKKRAQAQSKNNDPGTFKTI